MNRRGHTVAEILVSTFVFSLILTALFFVYRVGVQAMSKADTRLDVVSQAEVAFRRLSREVERSLFFSCTVEPAGRGFSILSAVDKDDVFRYDPGMQLPIWQKYQIFYHDDATKTLCVRTVDLPALAPQAQNPTRIELCVGLQPLQAYFTNGSVIARHVVGARFLLTSDRLLKTTLTTEKQGLRGVERCVLTHTVAFRN